MMGVSVRYVRKLAAEKKLIFVPDVFGTFSASRAHVEAFMRERRARAADAAVLRERRDERALFGRERVEREAVDRPIEDETEGFEDSPDTERSPHAPSHGVPIAEPTAGRSPVLGPLRVELRGGTLAVFGAKRSTPVVIGECAVVVGRNSRCTLVLDDKKISKLHAAFVATERGVRLRDLGSRNGTYIGSVRVWEVYLTAPSIVFCGETRLRFSPARAPGRQRSGTSKKPSR